MSLFDGNFSQQDDDNDYEDFMMKTTIELAKECGAEEYKANGEVSAIYFVDYIQLEAFRKACIADYVSRCELVGYTAIYDISAIKNKSDSTGLYKVKEECEYSIKLFTLPNNGE